MYMYIHSATQHTTTLHNSLQHNTPYRPQRNTLCTPQHSSLQHSTTQDNSPQDNTPHYNTIHHTTPHHTTPHHKISIRLFSNSRRQEWWINSPKTQTTDLQTKGVYSFFQPLFSYIQLIFCSCYIVYVSPFHVNGLYMYMYMYTHMCTCSLLQSP